MPTPHDFKETLRQQADIVRIVGDYVKLRKSGAQNYQGLCPFHNEKTPSFSVHATRQFYHCFGCGASGDVFSFVQKIENITFPEALRLIAQKLDIPLPKMQFDSPTEERDARLRMQLMDVQERACAWFQEQLRKPEAAHAREYLAGRGLNEEMIARFRIGYAPESGFLLRDRLRGDFDEEILRTSGLFSWKHDSADTAHKSADPIYSKFRNRVTFPITNESGRVIAFTGRTLSADEKAGPKYLNSPETPIYSKSRILFNLDRAKEAIRALGYAILVEGQMDCISVFAAGFHNVVASSGTAFTESQARLLARFSRNIVVSFDPDLAGAAAAERSLALLVEEDFDIKVVQLEAGFDPDLYIRKKGREAYAAALKSAPRYFDYLIARARMKFPVRTPEGKVKALNFLLPHVQRAPSRIARDEIAGEIAQKLAIDSTVLRQELRHAATARGTRQVKAPPVAQVTEAERILIRALSFRGMLGGADGHVSSRDGAEEEFDPARQARFALKIEPLHEGLAAESLISALLEAEDASPGSLELGEGDRQLMAECLMSEEEELTPELLEGAILALKRRKLERSQRQVRAEIAEAERKQDTAGLTTLLKKKLEIDRELSAGHLGNRVTGT
ncbi:MAG TPA: DNA primase [Terriglobales bacterium]|nr:DNA primase [Terriglobales bacterium]